VHATSKYLAAAFAAIFITGASAWIAKDIRGSSPSAAVASDESSPIYGVTIPTGYRQWELVAPSHEAASTSYEPFSEIL
jgi:hypothetical protein